MRRYVIGLFLAGACLLWLPFRTQHSVYATQRVHAVPAGQITAGFVLRQTVLPRSGKDSLVDHEGHEATCFGIRFATYMRSNSGSIQVAWRQDGRTEGWRVDAGDLQDNAFRYFCPRERFILTEPFALEIKGLDGRAGDSATLWLTGDTRLGTATLGTGAPTGKALALDVATRRRHAGLALLSIDHGAFLFGWLCTLLAGVIALHFGFGPTGWGLPKT